MEAGYKKSNTNNTHGNEIQTHKNQQLAHFFQLFEKFSLKVSNRHGTFPEYWAKEYFRCHRSNQLKTLVLSTAICAMPVRSCPVVHAGKKVSMQSFVGVFVG
eukprot:m.28135 g.28135  ORF g.28135 m.28135 type:complete len:102 (+) comp14082_c0_seq1:133-438(+)